MSKVSREVRINAPKEKVWEALADFGGIQIFNPSVIKSYTINSKNEGVGASRRCELNIPGSHIDERVTEWVDGEKMVIEIYDGKKAPPFKRAFATISIREDGPNTTIATGVIEYKLKFGPIGALMDVALVKPQFGKGFGGLMAGLKHYVETGESVDGPTGLDFSSVQAIPA